MGPRQRAPRRLIHHSDRGLQYLGIRNTEVGAIRHGTRFDEATFDVSLEAIVRDSVAH